MNLHLFFALLLAFSAAGLAAQDAAGPLHNSTPSLPYYQIPDYPAAYTPEAVAARMVDGLGFRYYWATEGLRAEDLAFRPNESARTTEETLQHIHGLSTLILNACLQRANESQGESAPLSFEQLRRTTLENLKMAADKLRTSPAGALADYNIVFQRGEATREFPFWNLINGPIADAIWHTGQVVSFRRSSGNPINPKVSVFSGKLVE